MGLILTIKLNRNDYNIILGFAIREMKDTLKLREIL